jgi:hypothetical protein
MGLIILAGLLNSTSVQQEMDALYGSFKSATYDRAEHVLMEKIKERGQQVRRRQGDGLLPPKGAPSRNLSLGFNDLATIVDGNKDDDLSMKPFTKNFTREKIVIALAKIGFFPFTRNCLNDKKVRHELGQADVNDVIETLHAKYVNLVAVVEDQGVEPKCF